jgi:hypothetical protein
MCEKSPNNVPGSQQTDVLRYSNNRYPKLADPPRFSHDGKANSRTATTKSGPESTSPRTDPRKPLHSFYHRALERSLRLSVTTQTIQAPRSLPQPNSTALSYSRTRHSCPTATDIELWIMVNLRSGTPPCLQNTLRRSIHPHAAQNSKHNSGHPLLSSTQMNSQPA